MKITRIGTDLVNIDEDTDLRPLLKIPRIHLIKLNFYRPTEFTVRKILKTFPNTNRYIIEDNIKIYNDILRNTSKKYYVMNKEHIDIISFFRKNNKILMNFCRFSEEENRFFLSEGIFEDILRNVEVIAIYKRVYDEKMEVLDMWNGNVILIEDNKSL